MGTFGPWKADLIYDVALSASQNLHPATRIPGSNQTAVLQLEAEPQIPSFLQLAKGVIGKDITQPMPMPVAMCEPSSDMVKRAEDLEYTELLDEVQSVTT